MGGGEGRRRVRGTGECRGEFEVYNSYQLKPGDEKNRRVGPGRVNSIQSAIKCLEGSVL